MIFKLTFDDDRIEWCNAKDILHLLKSYDSEYELSLQELEAIEEVSDEEAKTTMVRNTDFDEDHPDDMPEKICLYDLVNAEDFAIIASTEF